MESMLLDISRDHAIRKDAQDYLRSFRELFHIPKQANGEEHIYLCGNSLGLQAKSTKEALHQELQSWQDLGVEGHFHGKNPWVPYHEYLTEAMSDIVGAKQNEVVVMNTLTVNLHLMLVSFYRPTKHRYKILIESDAFPSDRFAAESQIRFHGFDPADALIEIKPRDSETLLRHEDIKAIIEQEGDEVALILFGNTNYYTGQFLPISKITEWGHAKGCMVGFDCAHAAGNMDLQLHDSGCDFAVWCTYKYLNGGPGSLGGVFINEKHFDNKDIPRFEGWWGHNKETRFQMRDNFDPIFGVEAWQLSCPPVMSMVPVWNSLKLFKQAGIKNLRQKSISLTGYLEKLILTLGEDMVNIITPADKEERGAQLSLFVQNANKDLFKNITEEGVIVDWREPNVIRVAPAPMYNSYEDVWRFFTILKNNL
jgi:kynureninase